MIISLDVVEELLYEKINKVDQGKEMKVVKIILSIGFEVSIVLGNSLNHNIYYNIPTSKIIYNLIDIEDWEMVE